MFMQTIKRWLHNLFAWWPWGRSSVPSYSQARSISSASTPEQLWQTTMDGPATQPGATSVAVEHGQHGDIPGFPRPTIDERFERLAHPSSPLPDEQRGPSPLSPTTRDNTISGPSHKTTELPAFVQEHRRLEFLRYLVQRGIVSDYFSEKQNLEQQEPEQK